MPFGAAASGGRVVGASMGYLAIYAFLNLSAFAVAAWWGPATRRSGSRTTAGWCATSRGPAGRWPSRWSRWPGCRRASSGCSPRSWCSTRAAGPATWLAVVMAVNVAIGLVYYARWLAELFRPPRGGARLALRRTQRRRGRDRDDLHRRCGVLGLPRLAPGPGPRRPPVVRDVPLFHSRSAAGTHGLARGGRLRSWLRWYRLTGYADERTAMTRWTRDRDIDENDVEVHDQKHAAAGVTAVAVSMKRALEQMGADPHGRAPCSSSTRPTASTAMGCAWPDPDPDHRHTAEFCENGAKAVAEEATTRPRRPGVLRRSTRSPTWRERTDYWLGQQGRITEPMVPPRGRARTTSRSAGTTRSRWSASTLSGLASPDEAVFYTSGRTSNEAAFAYQLFARAFGTNNLPDCSNMCHESTSVALAEVDRHRQGQRQPRGRPRRRADRDHAARTRAPTTRGCSPRWRRRSRTAPRSSPINPLPEAGLMRFKNPQTPARRQRRRHRARRPAPADPDQRRPGAVPGDRRAAAAEDAPAAARTRPDFVERHTTGFEDVGRARPRRSTGTPCERATGPDPRADRGGRRDVRAPRRRPSSAGRWASPSTATPSRRSRRSPTSRFLQGNIGKPGAGLCPVRGHSNVQGDRTMGIWEKPPAHFLDALAEGVRLRAAPRARPRHRRRDPGAARRQGEGLLRAGRQLRLRRPRHRRSPRRRCATPTLTVQVSTKLNRSHVVRGRDGADPADPRAHRAGPHRRPRPAGHRRGLDVARCTPRRAARARPRRTCAPRSTSSARSPQATLGDRHGDPVGGVPRRLHRDPPARSPASCPAATAYDEKVDRPGGFVLPHPPRDSRTFPTEAGQGGLHGEPARRAARARGPAAAADAAQSTTSSTPRSTASTTATAASQDGRRVVFVHPDDIADARASPTARSSTWSASGRTGPSGRRRRSGSSPTTTPRGCAAAYYPETNPLVPLDSTALGQQLPDVEVGHHPARPQRSPRGRQHRPRGRAGRGRGPQGTSPADPPELNAKQATVPSGSR